MNNFNRRDLLKTTPFALAVPSVLTGKATVASDATKAIPSLVAPIDDMLTVDERLFFQALQPFRDVWANTGLLQGIQRDDDMTVLAAALQNQHAFNAVSGSETSTLDEHAVKQIVADMGDVNCPILKRISIPITRRVWGTIAEDGWVPLYPTLSPSTFVWYWRLFGPTPAISEMVWGNNSTPKVQELRFVKESESVVMSMNPVGFKYPFHSDGMNQNDICVKLAETIVGHVQTNAFVDMHRWASTIHTMSLTELTHKNGLDSVLNQVSGSFGGYRAGRCMLIVPKASQELSALSLHSRFLKGDVTVKQADINLDDEYLASDNNYYSDRRPKGTIPAVVAWKGDRMTDNGYFVLPYITVAHRNGEIVSRYGRKFARCGEHFYAAINIKP